MKLSLIVAISTMSVAGVSAATPTILVEDTYDENCHQYAFYGGGTRKFSAAISWTEANVEDRCGGISPHLATITSDGENSFIATMIKDLEDKYGWIGGQDTLVEGEFVWVTGETWEYTHWGTDPYQPDNAFGREEDCVQFTTQMNDATLMEDFWNDLDCEYKRPFIVEWDCVCPEPTKESKTTKDSTTGGDPHFKTWTGELYDFHGICDLVLLTNPDFSNNLGMEIHIRTEQTKSWAYISAAVIRIGRDTLEVRGGQQAHYWVNGIEGAPLSDLTFEVVYERPNSKQHKFTIAYGENSSIVMKTFKDFVRVDINEASKEDFEHSLGLMGTFNDGVKIGRDGMTVVDDINAFGQEWQVLPEETTLFHNLEGPQAPEQCRIPKATSLRRRLAEIDVTIEDAEVACSRVSPAEFDMCVFDVIATNDKEMAGAY